MFSKTCQYAIRALIFIGQQTKEGSRVGIKEISAGIDSPEYFIAKILQDLSRKNYVKSAKGPNGGFFMNEENLDTSIAEIVKEMDGNKIFSGCGLGLKLCSEDHPCPIHEDFKHVRKQIQEMLESSKISLFVNDLDQKMIFLKR